MQYGFTNRAGDKAMDPSIRNNFNDLLTHEAEVRAWWATVDEKKKRNWLSASAVYKNWNASRKPKSTSTPTRNDKQTIKELEEQVRDLAGRVEEVSQERDSARDQVRELETTQREPMFSNGTSEPRENVAALRKDLEGRIEEAERQRDQALAEMDLAKQRKGLVEKLQEQVAELEGLLDKLVTYVNGLLHNISPKENARELRAILREKVPGVVERYPQLVDDEEAPKPRNTKKPRGRAPVPQWTGDEGFATASAGDGWEYRLARFDILGSGGIGRGGYTVFFMPVGTKADKMKDYKIGTVSTLEKAKAVAEKHFAKRQKP